MRKTSQAAIVAKEIRKELKQLFPLIKFKVTSQSYSMGNAVYVEASREHVSLYNDFQKVTEKYSERTCLKQDDSWDFKANPMEIKRVSHCVLLWN